MPKSTAPSPSRLTVVAGLPPASHDVIPGEVVVGRSPSAQIILDHPSVEPFHCRLRLAKNGCQVEPLAHLSRTFLDGRVLPGGSVLRSGQILSVGEVSLLAEEESSEPPESGIHAILTEGRRVTHIPMVHGTRRIGRDVDCEIMLPDNGVALFQAVLDGDDASGYRIALAEGASGLRANGMLVESHRLVFGDEIALGPYRFLFDGVGLQLENSESALPIQAKDVTVRRAEKTLLGGVSLGISGGEFVGVIGPTGAGKSTLLRTVAGLRRPDQGEVLAGGRDLYSHWKALRHEIGWVPQADIVHRELTVAQALAFAARMRLPRDISRNEIARLVAAVTERLGLSDVLESRIGTLSGGEAKKVSVAAELLSRPRVLVLDEPTSGLDPGAEARLMEHLRRLADSGCAVLCSTHVMKHMFLFDRAVVMAEGVQVFEGNAAEARAFFQTQDAEGIFARLEQRPAQEWQAAFEGRTAAAEPSTEIRPLPPAPRRAWQFPILLGRQAAILLADFRTPLILAGQPLLIGLLLAWTINGTADDSALKLFFISISCLWFGCSNGAPEIVGEREIYLRERMAGLGRTWYAAAKWAFGGTVTLLQTLFLYALTKGLGEGLSGSPAWQLGGLAAMSYLATAIGLAMSAAARTPMQAVLLVPVFMIPQILLSGFTVPAASMNTGVLRVAEWMPAFQLQRTMDFSLIWNRKIDAALVENHLQAFRNVNLVAGLKLGDTYSSFQPAGQAAAIGAGWLGAAAVVIFLALARRERA